MKTKCSRYAYITYYTIWYIFGIILTSTFTRNSVVIVTVVLYIIWKCSTDKNKNMTCIYPRNLWFQCNFWYWITRNDTFSNYEGSSDTLPRTYWDAYTYENTSRSINENTFSLELLDGVLFWDPWKCKINHLEMCDSDKQITFQKRQM